MRGAPRRGTPHLAASNLSPVEPLGTLTGSTQHSVPADDHNSEPADRHEHNVMVLLPLPVSSSCGRDPSAEVVVDVDGRRLLLAELTPVRRIRPKRGCAASCRST